MPSGLVSDRPSMSMSNRVTSYAVARFSYAAAIWLTSLQESPISVPFWSALQPPKDGTTSPPSARNDAMSAWYAPEATVRDDEPSQASVHEVLPSVSRNASVKWASRPRNRERIGYAFPKRGWLGRLTAHPKATHRPEARPYVRHVAGK